MDSKLALRFLSQVMEWDDDQAKEQFAWLSLMAEVKYDDYLGYGPGNRFLEALLYWLQQFQTKEDRFLAYNFVRRRLVFLSRAEMLHLVENTWPKVEEIIRQEVATRMDIPPYKVNMTEEGVRQLNIARRKTLFVALSDGARIDFFRRANEELISNEQVVAFHEFGAQKWKKLGKKLERDLEQLGVEEGECHFDFVCLLDDFVGSGYTLIREEEGRIDGKIGKFIGEEMARLQLGIVLARPCTLIVHHYVASYAGAKTVECEIQRLVNQRETDFSCRCSFGMVLPESLPVSVERDGQEFVKLLQRYYDSSVETEHSAGSVCLGYRDCALPLVLDHNTPNNSIALLWATTPDEDGQHRMRPLFPRKQRHL